MKISIIVAASENGVIGNKGTLPWKLSADLRRFKALTMGHCLLIGRKTWESIGRPLPGRHILVLSRLSSLEGSGETVELLSSMDALSRKRECKNEIFVGGGSEVYRMTLPLASTLYLTRVHATIDGDTFLPEIDFNSWNLISRKDFEANEKNSLPFSFLHYERRSSEL